MTPAETVLRLIKLATDGAASEAEARTAALIACRVIRSHDLRVVPERELTVPAGVPTRVTIVSRYAGFCRLCRRPYEIGDEIAWSRGGGGMHVRCYRAPTQ